MARPCIVPIATRKEYLGIVHASVSAAFREEQCRLGARESAWHGCDAVAAARNLERSAYEAATWRAEGLAHASDPLAALHAPADVAAGACADYCSAVRRALAFLEDYGIGSLVNAIACLKQEQAESVVSCSDGGIACTDGGIVGCNDIGTDSGIGGATSWAIRLGALTDDSAAALAVHVAQLLPSSALPWCGWKAQSERLAAAATAELTRERADEKVSIYRCEACGSHDLDEERLQVRSADEGETLFLKCRKCGTRSKTNT